MLGISRVAVFKKIKKVKSAEIGRSYAISMEYTHDLMDHASILTEEKKWKLKMR